MQTQGTNSLQQQRNPSQTAQPIESPDRLIFRSEENGKFENWKATYHIANNLTPKTSFTELKHFFDGLQKLEFYDIDKIWKKAKSNCFLKFVAWSLAQIVCYSILSNLRIEGVIFFIFIVVSTVQFLNSTKSIKITYEKELTLRLSEIKGYVANFNKYVFQKSGLVLIQLKQGAWQILKEKGDNDPQVNQPNYTQMNTRAFSNENDLTENFIEMELNVIDKDIQVHEECDDVFQKKQSNHKSEIIGSKKTSQCTFI